MALHWKWRLLFGLGLTMTLALAVALPAAASAASTLTGETLNGSSSQGNGSACPANGYSVSGTATVPYAGTFTETGTWSGSGTVSGETGPFSATFTITSGTTTITGSKGPATVGSGGVSGTITCSGMVGIGNANANLTGVPYTATIQTPNGNFHDEGVSTVSARIVGSAGAGGDPGSATLTESFTSSLTEPVLIGPTSKGRCKKGGWKEFPQFKNQGQCVSFVLT